MGGLRWYLPILSGGWAWFLSTLIGLYVITDSPQPTESSVSVQVKTEASAMVKLGC